MFHASTRTVQRDLWRSKWADEEMIDVVSVLHLPRFASLGFDWRSVRFG